MVEYQDILRLLADNPPQDEPEKKMHSLVLEMLVKKLNGDGAISDAKVLKAGARLPNQSKKLH